MAALLRSASLTHFAALCGAHGVDAYALLPQVGLPRRALDDPDLMVPAAAVGRVLDLAAQQCREPAFGVQLAGSRRLSNLGPLGLLVRDEPTLRQALEAIVANLHLHNEALSIHTEQVGNLVTIRAHLDAGDGRPQVQATELVVAVMFRVLGIFMGAGWRPRLVCFSHPAPGDTAAHRRLFGPAVEFGHEFDGMVCNAADLDAPNAAADPVMARYTARLLGPGVRRRACVADRVREFIVLLLPRGHCRVEVVAEHLGVDRRTVARQLVREGTSFSILLNGVREDLLERYLKEGTRPLADVASLLGFSEPSAFSRWHRLRFGTVASARLERAPSLAAGGLSRPRSRAGGRPGSDGTGRRGR
ncbi:MULTISPECIES: AraC family transcriptional regulator [Ramlibacter]|uniref:AraC family transcriptional regulator ligand-binding domain-containing protein n=1 Tax=Ramlibacter aquaticus TaxID=2780094 RepID=A0ABR9SJU6_9BURK|nr:MULTISPECIES: AraC family transcriptional regulator [Ramlibacter]MBE7942638.1 AraC family transcriptional regulator ligand-binding domain-containing protein [Ramlibacter aquaticus]